MGDINSMSRGNALTQTGATQYHVQLGLPDKGRAIKGLVVCNEVLIIYASLSADTLYILIFVYLI